MVVGRTLEKLQTTVDEIRKQGGIAIAQAGDVSCEADVIASVEKCVSEFGGLNVYFANAGAWIGAIPVFEQRVEQWQDIFRINTIGSFLALKHAGAYMAKQGSGGSLIFMSSVAALRGNGGDAAYSATKASVNSLTQMAPMNWLAPMFALTPLLRAWWKQREHPTFFEAARAKGVAEKIGKNNPLRRPERPKEIAAVAAFWQVRNPPISMAKLLLSMAESTAHIPLAERHKCRPWKGVAGKLKVIIKIREEYKCAV